MTFHQDGNSVSREPINTPELATAVAVSLKYAIQGSEGCSHQTLGWGTLRVDLSQGWRELKKGGLQLPKPGLQPQREQLQPLRELLQPPGEREGFHSWPLVKEGGPAATPSSHPVAEEEKLTPLQRLGLQSCL